MGNCWLEKVDASDGWLKDIAGSDCQLQKVDESVGNCWLEKVDVSDGWLKNIAECDGQLQKVDESDDWDENDGCLENMDLNSVTAFL